MKTNFLRFAIVFLVMLSGTSCVHYYYAPSANNVPLFKEKNEVRIQAQYIDVGSNPSNANRTGGDYSNSGDNIGGFQLQTAYAAGKHLGLQLNYFHVSNEDPNNGSGNGSYIEAAAGYFKQLKNTQWVFETYGGIGSGTVKSTYKNNSSEASATTSFTKFLVQPSFGYSARHIAVAFSSKFSLVNFGVRSSSLDPNNFPIDYKEVESLRNYKSFFWWEPGLLIRGGFENLQAIIQYTWSVQDNDALPFFVNNLSIGIIVPFKITSNKNSVK
jgi:hypothetical protein